LKVLLTGAAGYLGSNLAHKFIEKGHLLLCVDKEGVSLQRLEDILDSITIVYSDDEKIAEKIEKFQPEAAVHTACLYEMEDYAPMVDANLLFPLKILNMCMEAGTKKWINTDTALPLLLNKYALIKHQFSQWGEYYSNHGKISFINLQLEHFYGENEPENHFFPRVVKSLKSNEPLDLTEGKQKRDFVYLEDLINIYSSLLVCEFEGYNMIPVGTGVAPSIREMIEYLHSMLNSESKLNFGAVKMRKNEPSSNCDTAALKALGLSCKTSWKDGMKKIWGENK